MKRLNVGCGRDFRIDFINLDAVALPGVDVVCDLEADTFVTTTENGHVVLEDGSFDFILMAHVIEHLKNPLLAMERLWNLAKPDAICQINCPYGSSDDAFEDPTHVRQYFVNSFGYFSQPWYWRTDYSYRGDWQVETIVLKVSAAQFRNKQKVEMLGMVNAHRNMVQEMVAKLRAIKPAREPKAELRTAPKIEFELV
jgi:predicted SAM-dependent methyltransferase